MEKFEYNNCSKRVFMRTRHLSFAMLGMALLATITFAAGFAEAAAQTPPPASGALPTSGLVAPLNDAFKIISKQPYGPPTLAENPVAPGSVEARWYQAAGNYVVYFSGLVLPTRPSICLHTSLRTRTGSTFSSSSPAGPDGCDLLPSPVKPGAVRLCGTKVFYLTDIKVDGAGDLYAASDRFFQDPGGLGRVEADVEGHVTADAAKAPVLDMTGCVAALTATPNAPATGTAVAPGEDGKPTAPTATGVALILAGAAFLSWRRPSWRS